MHAKYSSINNRSQCKVVKNFSAITPNVNGTILSQTFIIKAIDLSNLARLVVSSDQCYSFGISNLIKVKN